MNILKPLKNLNRICLKMGRKVSSEKNKIYLAEQARNLAGMMMALNKSSSTPQKL